jgi:hypothetical protein
MCEGVAEQVEVATRIIAWRLNWQWPGSAVVAGSSLHEGGLVHSDRMGASQPTWLEQDKTWPVIQALSAHLDAMK